MEPVRCFLLSPVAKLDRALRRFTFGSEAERPACVDKYGHDSDRVWVERMAWPEDDLVIPHVDPREFAGDPRWPTRCGRCPYEFRPDDHWQVSMHRVYQRGDTGDLLKLQDAPPGALWNADWMLENLDPAVHKNRWRGPDGHCLIARLPDGRDWMIDGTASNCTLPDDFVHKCWVRHGAPPDVTVDKNGVTCSAGGGSIATPGWHGFLRKGYLVLS